MKKTAAFLKNNKFNCIVIILYLIITIFAAVHHELWRDEAQVWCIVRDMNFPQIFNDSRIEGHPMLWYLILTPFAKAGISVIAMQVISLLFVLTGVVYFLFKSPFNNIIKTLVVFSSGILYYMPVISRNYSLVPVLLFLAAGLYGKRKENPVLYSIIIVLLANTHILMLGFCLILAFIFCIELIKDKAEQFHDKDNPAENCGIRLIKLKKQKLAAVLILAVNFLFLFLCFYQMRNINHAAVFYAQNPKDIITAVNYFAQTFFLFPLTMLPEWITSGLFYILIFITLGFYFKNNKKIFLILAGALCFQWWVYYKVWYIGIVYQKSFLLLLIILFCCWIYTENAENTKNKTNLITWITIIFFAASFISAPFNIIIEKDYQYSGSRQIADYIRKNLNDEKEFTVWGYPFCFSVISAYLPDKKLYMIDKEYYITYYSFDLDSKSEKQPNPGSKYYITVANFTIGQNYEKIFQTDPNIINLTEYNEIFSIYKKKD